MAAHMLAAFSALKGPAPKTESCEGHMPRVFYAARNCRAALLGVLTNCARFAVCRKPPPPNLAGSSKRSRTETRSSFDSDSPFGSRGPAPRQMA